jgi:hypothetical protein
MSERARECGLVGSGVVVFGAASRLRLRLSGASKRLGLRFFSGGGNRELLQPVEVEIAVAAS